MKYIPRRVLSAARAVVLLGALAPVFTVNPAAAGDDSNSGTSYYAGLSCNQLWYERNAIAASKGYCFKTKRGRAAFPNSCFPPYGKLPNNLSRTMKLIQSWERRRGC